MRGLRIAAAGSALCAYQPAYGQGAAPTTGPLQVHLECEGTGTYPGRDRQMHAVPSDVYVDISGDTGRIKLPDVLIPPIHDGPPDAWRNLYAISITDDAVQAKFSINWINKPKVSIDRQTGHIDFRGYAGLSFSGACRPYSGEKVF